MFNAHVSSLALTYPTAMASELRMEHLASTTTWSGVWSRTCYDRFHGDSYGCHDYADGVSEIEVSYVRRTNRTDQALESRSSCIAADLHAKAGPKKVLFANPWFPVVQGFFKLGSAPLRFALPFRRTAIQPTIQTTR